MFSALTTVMVRKRVMAVSAVLALAAIVAVTVNVSARTAEAAFGGVEVYLGGYPVNIELYTSGPAVASVSAEVEACGLEEGDIVTHVNGVRVSYACDAESVLSVSGDSALFQVMRNGERLAVDVPDADGVTFGEGISGLGTVTFEKSDGSYRALGHAITSAGKTVSAEYGYIYDSEIIGAKLPSGGAAGRLVGRRRGSEPIGNILSNDTFGLSGKMFGQARGEEFTVMSHDEVRPGKALIYSTVDSERRAYEIEIVKAKKSDSRGEKSMVIRVTDEALLEKTGGILQGMSGSPIVQDGKLAGAVTHVFTGDPTRGYGVFAEWML